MSKHAGAHRVGMTLSYMEDVVSLDVRDDGVGFEPSLIGEAATDGRSAVGEVLPGRPGSARQGDVLFQKGSFGLIAMRERVSSLGGSLVIETSPGEGTAICASVPRTPSQVAKDYADPADHRGRPSVVRDGLRGMFAGAGDIDVVGEAADGAEAVECRATDPDVVLLDLRMPADGVAPSGCAPRSGRTSSGRHHHHTDADVLPGDRGRKPPVTSSDAPGTNCSVPWAAARRGRPRPAVDASLCLGYAAPPRSRSPHERSRCCVSSLAAPAIGTPPRPSL